jgi:hypothetical protein
MRMALGKEEKRILKEIERWRSAPFRSGAVSEAIDSFFGPVENMVERAIPEKVYDRISAPLAGTLMKFQALSNEFVGLKAIVRKACRAGLKVSEVEEFRKAPIEYLDVLAESVSKKTVLYTTLHGVGSGAAGGAFFLADLPVIFTLNLKMILQIGACYGYRHDSIWDREFALQIFCVASSPGREKREQMRRLDGLIGSFISGKFSKKNSILMSEDGTKVFISRMLRWFVRKHLTRELFVLGMVLGSGANYIYTKDTAVCAYMFYRKRFLKEKAVGVYSG